MSKLYINYEGLNNYFYPYITNTIDELTTAINYLENLDIPSGFSYKSYLKSIPNLLNDHKNNCLKVKQYVTNSLVNYKISIQEINKLFDKLDKKEIN